MSVSISDSGIVFNDGSLQPTALTTGTQTIAGAKTFSTTPIFSAAPAFLAKASTSQSVTTNVITKVVFDTEIADTNNNFASSTFTPTVAGYYQLNATLRTDAASSSLTQTQLVFYKNGATYQMGHSVTCSAQANNIVSASSVIYMNGTTDYVEVYGLAVGTTPTFSSTSTSNTSWFSGSLVRAT